MSASIRLASITGLALVVACTGAALGAQTTIPLDQGARVRIGSSVTPRPLVGRFDMILGDTLYLQTSESIQRIPLATVTSLEVRRGSHGHALQGALIGAGALGAVGLADGDDPPDQWFGMSAGQKGAIGAVLGAALGGLVGALSRSDSWETVSLDRVRVAPVSARRVAIAVSFSL